MTDAIFENLVSSSTYFWRVRYRNQNLEWSPWSTSTSFHIEGGTSRDTISSNLLLNGGAEDGVNGWTGDVESLENAECNSILPFEGSHNFGVGGICANESTYGQAYQSIDLSTFEDQIDADTTAVTLIGYMRNFNGSDVPEMYLELYAGTQLVSTSPIKAGNTATWTQYQSTVHVPIGTDSCVVFLTGTRNAGSDNDSYFDELATFVIKDVSCPTCIGDSNTDLDNDGYCSDVDCNDDDSTIYPGAIDKCDGVDRNCDGLSIDSDTVWWTGQGDGTTWEDGKNWDQQTIPLACQHVVIESNAIVLLSTPQQCLSITVTEASTLTIDLKGILLADGEGDDSSPTMIVDGAIQNYGRCIIRNAEEYAITVSGVLINEGILSTATNIQNAVIVQQGGLFSSEGVTVIK